MKIMIGCSSRSEISPKYLKLADSVSKKCAELGFELCFGAASTGMMGECAKNISSVYSYTVSKYVDDLKNINSKEEFILDTTFDRTKEMFYDSDIIILLPGGTGTLAEVFGILEENRSIDNPKRVVLLNFDGYYDPIIRMIDNCIELNFNSANIYDFIKVVTTEDELFQIIKSVL